MPTFPLDIVGCRGLNVILFLNALFCQGGFFLKCLKFTCSCLLVLCLCFSLALTSSALESMSVTIYQYNEDKGGFYLGSSYTSLNDYPYGEASRIFEGRNSRNISSSTRRDIYCFTFPEVFATYCCAAQGSISQSFSTPISSWSHDTSYLDYLGSGFYSEGSKNHLYIYSALPIMHYESGQWVVPVTQKKETIKYTDSSGYSLDCTVYVVSVDVSYTFTVMNYVPFNIMTCDYPSCTAYKNAYAYYPTKSELSTDYTSLLSRIDGKLNNLNENIIPAIARDISVINSRVSECSSFLDNIEDYTALTASDFEEFKEFYYNNVYSLMETIDWDIFTGFDSIIQKLDEQFNSKPSNGFGEFEPSDTFDNMFSMGSDMIDPSQGLNQFKNGILAFTHIYNNLDNSFGGLISIAISVVLGVCFIGYLLGRRVNK